MRICFVTPSYALYPPFGGIGTQIRTMARWMAQQGHDTHVVCLTREISVATENDGGVQVHWATPKRIKPRRLLSYIAKIPGLRGVKEAYYGWGLVEDSLGVWLKVRALEHEQPFDIIQCSDYGGLGLWGVFPFKRSRPFLLRGHGLVSMYLPFRQWPGALFQHKLEAICARRAHFILPVSKALAELYRTQFTLLGEQLGVLYRPLDITDLVEELTPITTRSETPQILYVGRIEHGKGCDILFEALEMVKQVEPEVQAGFIGLPVPQIEAQFQIFLQRHGDWVTHFGHLPQREVFRQMLQSTVLVLPSRTESAGAVLAEAQVCGLPQVASRVGGIPEYVEDGISGILVEPEDPAKLASAILKISQSPELQAAMSRQSRLLAQERYSIDSVMSQFVQICETMVAGKTPHHLTSSV